MVDEVGKHRPKDGPPELSEVLDVDLAVEVRPVLAGIL